MSSSSLQQSIARWVDPGIRTLSTYSVPDATGLIKLDAMENPYHWPEPLIDEWLFRLRRVHLNRYPDPAARQLAATLRKVMGVPDSAAVLLGNGSDELIQIIAQTLAGSSRCLMAPEPGFVMYRMIAIFTRMEYQGIPLREDFSLDLPAMLTAIEQHQPAVIFLAYPNNPTGNLFDEQQICRIVEASPGVVVVDEAYHAFAQASFMDRLLDHENLLVMRTVSKLGLAGLRLGLLAGAQAWIEEFDKVRLPYNINTLTQASANFALQHHKMLDEQTARIRTDRDRLMNDMCLIEEITVYPSRANFILFRVTRSQGNQVFNALLKQGFLVKNLNNAGGALSDCLRVTIGTPQENQGFIETLSGVISKI